MNKKVIKEKLMEELAPKRTKVKRRRKPMTEEQKKAAAERLAKAREKRQKANPPEYKHIHSSVLAKPDEDTFSRKNVTGWIKHQKGLLSEYRRQERQQVKGATMRVADTQAYIRHCEWYLKNGDWIDNRYGRDAQNTVKWVTVVPAGDK